MPLFSSSSSSTGKSKKAPEPALQTLVVGGLAANVYSQPKATPAGAPVVVAFLLHGRNGSALKMGEFVNGLFDEVHALRRTHAGPHAARDLYIVTIDHRNHGKRLVDKQANQGWSDDAEKNNPRHAIDMYAIQTGTAQDVSYLVDFLPAYLFPNGERTISQFVCIGKSLGGHATWLVLRNEPRIRIGVPVIAAPDYLALMSRRARSHKLPVGPPYFPQVLLDLIARADPAAAPYAAAGPENPFRGKKVLVLSGAEDKKVPWAVAKEFVERLNVGGEQEGGVKEVIVEDGTGHEFSPGMVKEAARFVWKHALVV
ncbi:Alpha/Beta hydrolase protein [Trametes elegans]|nr:Alpha/Beta hydrolase protein [Trametes elegans]